MEPEKGKMEDEEIMEVGKHRKLGGIKTMPFILVAGHSPSLTHQNTITFFTQLLTLFFFFWKAIGFEGSLESTKEELSIPLVVSSGSTDYHPSIHVSLSLMELRATQNQASETSLGEKEEHSAIKAGLRKVKIFKEYVSIKRGKKASGEDDHVISDSRSDEGDYSNLVDSDSLEDSGDGESFEDATVRKSFSYGTLAYANYNDGSLFEDNLYYSNQKSDDGCSSKNDPTVSSSEQGMTQIPKRSILPWKKRKLNFKSPLPKGEPLLKKDYAEEGGDDIDFDRRQLSSDESLPKLTQVTNFGSEFGDDSFAIGNWEQREIISRDANEICDRFAATGFHANLITYLTDQLNMPLVQASNTLTNFSGVASFMPIIGALIADSFAGRFWTIIVALLFYELGMMIITISAAMPQFRPPQCPTQIDCTEASESQLWVLYISLVLTSIGLGGTRPCVVAFAADQLDISKPKSHPKTWNFFNVYYFFLSLASLSALTVVVYIQDYVSWGWGLGIPTIAMGIAFAAFLVGSPIYLKVKSEGSPFVRLAQVVVAGVKKRKEKVVPDDSCLYENEELDAGISKDGRLVHTNQLSPAQEASGVLPKVSGSSLGVSLKRCARGGRGAIPVWSVSPAPSGMAGARSNVPWLDKAAIVTDDDTDLISKSPKLWRLATVHRVEELKSMIRLLPIISTGIIYVMAYSHQASFTVIQARSMDRRLSPSFEIPPASMAVFGVLGTLITLATYDRLFVPLAYRFTKNPSGITCLQRIGVGFIINILATFIAAFVEIKRKQAAKDHNLLDKPTVMIPISVFWLVPQYSLHGVAEAMFHVGKLEFLYDQSPESMKSTALALYWSAIAVGQYAGTLMVTVVHKYTDKNGGNWLPDRNLNRGRLEYYYMLISGIQVLNLFYYFACAWFYTYKPLKETEKCKQDGDLEFVTL
ncbi:hypothetical protein LXL04_018433 [Taraxacum kok-saghyz]